MSRVMTIAGREIRSSLSSLLAYAFIAAFVGAGLYFFFIKEKFFGNDQVSTRGFFRWIPYITAGLAPALTMRMWTEERKLGTYEILATLPVRPWELVVGKFLGAFALLVVSLIFTFGIPLVANSYGDLDWGPVVGGYIGSLLVGAAFLSVGLTASLLVRDQLLALLVGWLACIAAFVPALLGAETFDFAARFTGIERGVLDLASLIFYGSMIALFLYTNIALVTWRRFAS